MLHRHHVIPKHEWKERFGSLKGVNCKENLIHLTVPQHAEVHRWLWEHYNRWEDKVAYQFLSNQITRTELQREMGKQVGLSRKGIRRVFTKEHKRNLSLANSGSNKGISKGPWTEDHRRNMSLSQTGKRHSEETKKKLSLAITAYYSAKRLNI